MFVSFIEKGAIVADEWQIIPVIKPVVYDLLVSGLVMIILDWVYEINYY